MKINHGSTIDNFMIYHEGNHNSKGNPHNQYNIPIFKLPNSQGYTGYWTKIFSYAFSNYSRAYAVIELWSDATFALRTRGRLTLDLSVFSTGTVDIQIAYRNKNPQNGNIFNMFAGFYKANADGTTQIEVYMNLPQAGELIKIAPYVFTFTKNSQQVLYKESYVRRDIDCFSFLETYTPITTSAMTGAYTNSPVYNTIEGDAVIYSYQSLPTASAAYRGIRLTVYGSSTSVADKVYMCVQSATGTYSWVQIATG